MADGSGDNTGTMEASANHNSDCNGTVNQAFEDTENLRGTDANDGRTQETKKSEENGHSTNGELKSPTKDGLPPAEAVNLELVTMSPYTNSIPVKKESTELDMTDPYDEYFVPVNQHKKYIRGEKLYVTQDKRENLSANKKKCCCGVFVALVLGAAIAILVAVILTQENGGLNGSEARNYDKAGFGSNILPYTPPPRSPPSQPPPTTDMSQIYLRNVLEGELTIDNMEFTPGLSNSSSSEFKNLATSLEEEIKMALFDHQKLHYGASDISVKVIEFRPGSVIVTYRVGWKFKEGIHGASDPIDIEMLRAKLQKHLKDNDGFLYNYRVPVHSIKSNRVIDGCQIDNNGCSKGCVYNSTSLIISCTCPFGYKLAEDKKSCQEIDYMDMHPNSNFMPSSIPPEETHPQQEHDHSMEHEHHLEHEDDHEYLEEHRHHLEHEQEDKHPMEHEHHFGLNQEDKHHMDHEQPLGHEYPVEPEHTYHSTQEHSVDTHVEEYPKELENPPLVNRPMNEEKTEHVDDHMHSFEHDHVIESENPLSNEHKTINEHFAEHENNMTDGPVEHEPTVDHVHSIDVSSNFSTELPMKTSSDHSIDTNNHDDGFVDHEHPLVPPSEQPIESSHDNFDLTSQKTEESSQDKTQNQEHKEHLGYLPLPTSLPHEHEQGRTPYSTVLAEDEPLTEKINKTEENIKSSDSVALLVPPVDLQSHENSTLKSDENELKGLQPPEYLPEYSTYPDMLPDTQTEGSVPMIPANKLMENVSEPMVENNHTLESMHNISETEVIKEHNMLNEADKSATLLETTTKKELDMLPHDRIIPVYEPSEEMIKTNETEHKESKGVVVVPEVTNINKTENDPIPLAINEELPKENEKTSNYTEVINELHSIEGNPFETERLNELQNTNETPVKLDNLYSDGNFTDKPIEHNAVETFREAKAKDFNNSTELDVIPDLSTAGNETSNNDATSVGRPENPEKSDSEMDLISPSTSSDSSLFNKDEMKNETGQANMEELANKDISLDHMPSVSEPEMSEGTNMNNAKENLEHLTINPLMKETKQPEEEKSNNNNESEESTAGLIKMTDQDDKTHGIEQLAEVTSTLNRNEEKTIMLKEHEAMPAVSVNEPVESVSEQAATVNEPLVLANNSAVSVSESAASVNEPPVLVSKPVVPVSEPTVSVSEPVESVSEATVSVSTPSISDNDNSLSTPGSMEKIKPISEAQDEENTAHPNLDMSSTASPIVAGIASEAPVNHDHKPEATTLTTESQGSIEQESLNKTEMKPEEMPMISVTSMPDLMGPFPVDSNSSQRPAEEQNQNDEISKERAHVNKLLDDETNNLNSLEDDYENDHIKNKYQKQGKSKLLKNFNVKEIYPHQNSTDKVPYHPITAEHASENNKTPEPESVNHLLSDEGYTTLSPIFTSKPESSPAPDSSTAKMETGEKDVTSGSSLSSAEAFTTSSPLFGTSSSSSSLPTTMMSRDEIMTTTPLIYDLMDGKKVDPTINEFSNADVAIQNITDSTGSSNDKISNGSEKIDLMSETTPASMKLDSLYSEPNPTELPANQREMGIEMFEQPSVTTMNPIKEVSPEMRDNENVEMKTEMPIAEDTPLPPAIKEHAKVNETEIASETNDDKSANTTVASLSDVLTKSLNESASLETQQTEISDPVVKLLMNSSYPNSTLYSKCASGQWACLDGSGCIAPNSRCDSDKDCLDGSDEANCQEQGCPGNFQCASKECLKRHLVCDSTPHCQDGSDEINCDEWKCNFDEMQCLPSSRQCIPSLWKCDTISHCPKNEDEIGCKDSCSNDEYLCPEGWCIPLSQKCDGKPDCAKGEDELNCPA